MQIKTFEIYCFGKGVVYQGTLAKYIFLPKVGDRVTIMKIPYRVESRNVDYDKQHITIYMRNLG